MAKRMIRQTECDTPREVCKLFQQLFDAQAAKDEYNETVDKYNRKVDKVNEDA